MACQVKIDIDNLGGQVPALLSHGLCSDNKDSLIAIGGTTNGSKYFPHVIFINKDRCQKRGVVVKHQTQPVGGHTLNFVNDRIYMYGGSDGQRMFGDIVVINKKTLEFRRVRTTAAGRQHQPLARVGHSAVADGNLLVVFGGYVNPIAETQDLFTFNTVTKEWQRPFVQVVSNEGSGTDLSRMGHAAAATDGLVFVFGGSRGNHLLDDLIFIDHRKGRMGVVPTGGQRPQSMTDGQLTPVGVSNLLLTGGVTLGNRIPRVNIHVFDVGTSVWTVPAISRDSPMGQFPPLSRHRAEVFGSRVLSFGGLLNGNPFSGVAEIDLVFDQQPGSNNNNNLQGKRNEETQLLSRQTNNGSDTVRLDRSEVVVIKVTWAKGQPVSKLIVNNKISFNQLVELLTENKFEIGDIFYTDLEGDKCVISNNLELSSAIREAGAKPLKISVKKMARKPIKQQQHNHQAQQPQQPQQSTTRTPYWAIRLYSLDVPADPSKEAPWIELGPGRHEIGRGAMTKMTNAACSKSQLVIIVSARERKATVRRVGVNPSFLWGPRGHQMDRRGVELTTEATRLLDHSHVSLLLEFYRFHVKFADEDGTFPPDWMAEARKNKNTSPEQMPLVVGIGPAVEDLNKPNNKQSKQSPRKRDGDPTEPEESEKPDNNEKEPDNNEKEPDNNEKKPESNEKNPENNEKEPENNETEQETTEKPEVS